MFPGYTILELQNTQVQNYQVTKVPMVNKIPNGHKISNLNFNRS